MATYEKIFRNNYDVDGLQLPTDVINEIHVIANARYQDMTEGPGKRVYISALFLDPSMYMWASD